MFFLVVGNRYRTRSEGTTYDVVRCPNCGTTGRFEKKSGRQWLTLFFVLPVVPLGGRRSFVECPSCHARFAERFSAPAAG
jgi:RNase P subunit RPR2